MIDVLRLIYFYDVAYQQGQVSYQENNKIALFPFYYLLIGNYTCILNFSRTIPTNYFLRVRFLRNKRKFIESRHISPNVKDFAAPFTSLRFITIVNMAKKHHVVLASYFVCTNYVLILPCLMICALYFDYISMCFQAFKSCTTSVD